MYKTKHILHTIVTIIVAANVAFAADESISPDWWNEEAPPRVLNVREDFYCAGHYILSDLVSSGLPLNIEFYPVVKGVDIVMEADSETGEKLWVEVKRDKAWSKFSASASSPDGGSKTEGTAKLSEIIQHYCQEAGGYRVEFQDSQAVLLPTNVASVCESVAIERIVRSGTNLIELFSNVLRQHDVGWAFDAGGFSRSFFPEEMKFDVDFRGGTLKEFLSCITSAMNAADPQHTYIWLLGGTNDSRTLSVSRISERQTEMLLSRPAETRETTTIVR